MTPTERTEMENLHQILHEITEKLENLPKTGNTNESNSHQNISAQDNVSVPKWWVRVWGAVLLILLPAVPTQFWIIYSVRENNKFRDKLDTHLDDREIHHYFRQRFNSELEDIEDKFERLQNKP